MVRSLRLTMKTYLAVLILSALTAYFLTPLVRRLAMRWGAMDLPDARKIHVRPMPRLGGLAVFGGFCSPWACFYLLDNLVTARFHNYEKLFLALMLGAAAMLALGIYDDLKGANAAKKFCVQIITATALYFGGFQITSLSNPFGAPFEVGWLSLPASVLWIVAITNAMNSLGGTGLWHEEDGFYYDQIHVDGRVIPLKIRSMVGLIPLFACEILEDSVLSRLPGFSRRKDWFLVHEKELASHITYHPGVDGAGGRHLLSIVPKERLARVLSYLLDEKEFLSPYGIRSLSKVHADHPYVFRVNGQEFRVDYTPGESTTGLFGGNSNWRGPVWMPVNYLLIEALERYHHFYGDEIRVECPTGSGRWMNLREVAQELGRRLSSLFLPDSEGHRPCHGDSGPMVHDPQWKDLTLFHEYFHAETGRGLGASHQSGWTALISRVIESCSSGKSTPGPL